MISFGVPEELYQGGRGFIPKKILKHDFETKVEPKGSPRGPTFCSALEAPGPNRGARVGNTNFPVQQIKKNNTLLMFRAKFQWIWVNMAKIRMPKNEHKSQFRPKTRPIINTSEWNYMPIYEHEPTQIWPIINFWTYIRHLTSRYWLLNIAKNILLNCSKESVGFIFEAYSIFLYYIYIKLLHIWLKFSVICFYKWLWY